MDSVPDRAEGTVPVEEHVRLRREHVALQARFEAADEVLSAMGRSAGDPDAVLSAVVDSARRLCRSDAAHVYLVEGGHFHLAATVGLDEESRRFISDSPITVDRGTLIGRVTLDRVTQQIADVLEDPDYTLLDLQRIAGYRTVLGAPMIVDGDVVGAINLWRNDVRPFEDREKVIVSAFAAQAAMAVNSVRLVQELEAKSQALEQASRHKSEFLASMSHELRTPLNAVLGFSEVLLERMFGDINEQQEEYLKDIHGSGVHLLELLNEILDLSKVEAGRMDLEVHEFDLAFLTETAVAMIRERAAAHGIALRVACDDDLVVSSDELRVKQVLINLLTNAVKFTPDGGSVDVHARRRDGEIEVTVRDTGVGIPPEDTERIFESFQQGRRGPAREEGTGLGLTLSRRLVELLGGRMWLRSEVGVGSTFGFSLPGASRPQAGTVPGDGAAREVVVIEDDRRSADLLSAYLAGVDLRVTAAGDGQSGLEAVRRLHPAVVLLDIRLPGVDGWSVLKALKSDDETRDIPVVVVSIVDERSRGRAMGAAAYLVKPVSRHELLEALEESGLEVHPRGAPRETEVR